VFVMAFGMEHYFHHKYHAHAEAATPAAAAAATEAPPAAKAARAEAAATVKAGIPAAAVAAVAVATGEAPLPTTMDDLAKAGLSDWLPGDVRLVTWIDHTRGCHQLVFFTHAN
jgi:hypothetical protein